jgi:hypothetical protein
MVDLISLNPTRGSKANRPFCSVMREQTFQHYSLGFCLRTLLAPGKNIVGDTLAVAGTEFLTKHSAVM